MEVGKLVLAAIVGWAVPLAMAWLVSKIPPIRKKLDENPTAKVIAVSCLLSALLSATAVLVYDKYVLPNQMSVWSSVAKAGNPAPTNGGYGPVTTTCPEGYYAVGLKSWGNSSPPYCIGCLVSTEIQCRKLPPVNGG